MDKIQTVDMVIALKELKKKAEQSKRDAIESIAEAEGVLASVNFLEKQFYIEIDNFNENRNDPNQ